MKGILNLIFLPIHWLLTVSHYLLAKPECIKSINLSFKPLSRLSSLTISFLSYSMHVVPYHPSFYSFCVHFGNCCLGHYLSIWVCFACFWILGKNLICLNQFWLCVRMGFSDVLEYMGRLLSWRSKVNLPVSTNRKECSSFLQLDAVYPVL